MPTPQFGPARPPHPGPFDASTMQPVPVAKVLAVLDHCRSSSLYPEYRDALSAALRVVEIVTGRDPPPIAVELALRTAQELAGDIEPDEAPALVRRDYRVICRLAGVAVPA